MLFISQLTRPGDILEACLPHLIASLRRLGFLLQPSVSLKRATEPGGASMILRPGTHTRGQLTLAKTMSTSEIIFLLFSKPLSLGISSFATFNDVGFFERFLRNIETVKGGVQHFFALETTVQDVITVKQTCCSSRKIIFSFNDSSDCIRSREHFCHNDKYCKLSKFLQRLACVVC